MILPGFANFKGVIGGTFDTVVTLYQSVPTAIWGGIWVHTTTYAVNTIVIGSDSKAYLALSSTTNVNPVSDGGVHWEVLSALNLTGYSATFQINTPGVTPNATVSSPTNITLGGSAGTVAINVPAIDMEPFSAQVYGCYLQITDTDSNVYFPIIGTIQIVNPITP